MIGSFLQEVYMSKLLIKNIGTMVSGDIFKPIVEADALLIEKGERTRYQGVGSGDRCGRDDYHSWTDRFPLPSSVWRFHPEAEDA